MNRHVGKVVPPCIGSKKLPADHVGNRDQRSPEPQFLLCKRPPDRLKRYPASDAGIIWSISPVIVTEKPMVPRLPENHEHQSCQRSSKKECLPPFAGET